MNHVNFTKERNRFGRQCLFSDRTELIWDERPNREITKEFIRRNPVHRTTQLTSEMSLSVVNTENSVYNSQGICHMEGGWPKDINLKDEEQPLRYRKKIMRDDIWAEKLPHLLETVEHAILQNAAVNIYEQYFENLEPVKLINTYDGQNISIFKDVAEYARPITSLSWSPDGKQIVGAYCNPNFTDLTHNDDQSSILWSLENTNTPLMKLKSENPNLCLEFNSNDQFLIAGGSTSGQVCLWDTKTGSKSVMNSKKEVSHTLRVNSLLWTSSKTNSEFFTGSSDGSVFFWDLRKFQGPTEILFLDPIDTTEQILSRSYGASILEYEPTIPTKYMVGTEQGIIFSCNRKGRNPIEKITSRYFCNSGKIYSLQRNPSFTKNYLSIGDYSAKIWSDEWKESSIIWTRQRNIPLTSGCWSPTRCSMFFVTKENGSFDAFDLLVDQEEPCFTMTLSSNPLLTLRAHSEGNLIAISDTNGSIYLVQLSENMTYSEKSERSIFSYLVERETKRERLYDGRMKEVKLKNRQPDDNKNDQNEDTEQNVKVDEIDLIKLAENEYLGMVNQEIKRRHSIEVKEIKTPFDKDFDFNTILSKDEIEKERQHRLQGIKDKVIRGLLKMNENQNETNNE